MSQSKAQFSGWPTASVQYLALWLQQLPAPLWWVAFDQLILDFMGTKDMLLYGQIGIVCSIGGRWYRCDQVEDSLDHCHCYSHLWGDRFVNNSGYKIFCISSESFVQVIQFVLFAKGEPQSWNYQEKASKQGKDWFLVSSIFFKENPFGPAETICMEVFTISSGCLHGRDCIDRGCLCRHHDGPQRLLINFF